MARPNIKIKSNVWYPHDSGNDLIGIGGPDERFGLSLVSVRKRLMAAWRSTSDRKVPRLSRRLSSLAKKPWTASGQEASLSVMEQSGGGDRARRAPWGVCDCRNCRELAGRDLGLDRVEETNELLMPVQHAAAIDPALEHVDRGEQRGGAVTKARQLSRAERRAMVERVNSILPISQQCRLLTVSRSAIYRKPAEASAQDLAIMPLIDRQYLARPYYGSRRMAAWLAPISASKHSRKRSRTMAGRKSSIPTRAAIHQR
jgi:hypothetical protein